VKGDRVEIVVDAGGSSRTYEIEATRAGRRVETTHGRGVVEVTEVTRGGTPVRTARFMSGRVLALVEHPAPRRAEDDEQVSAPVRSVRAA
jgi:hypothetical protein